MPGMHSGLDLNNPVLTNAFRSALAHQGLAVLLLLAAFLLAWAMISIRRPPRPAPTPSSPSPVPGAEPASLAPPTPPVPTALSDPAGPPGPVAAWVTGRPRAVRGVSPEPRWRAVLRVSFGLLWLVDALLQAQPGMVAGLPARVIQPGAASSPAWVRSLVSWGTAAWTYHPVQAAAAAVWIQAGLGVWLLAARRGRWSQAAGLAGVAWGLVVWVFGEAFGGLFAPGLTILFGAPGAALLYAVAGAVIALPPRAWPRLARWFLPGTALFLAGMAVLQAWPGRGFWSRPGSLAAMIRSMAQTPQPRPLARLVTSFGHLAAAHPTIINLAAVSVLAAAAAAFLTGRRALAAPAAAVLIVFCLADWLLIEDLGVFGGLGTDPNSMIPLIILIAAACLARFPAQQPQPQPHSQPSPVPATTPFTADLRTVAAVWALAVTVVGAWPLTAAAASRTADPVLARALDGSAAVVDFPAPAFTLTSQDGRAVSLAQLRGKTVLLTFLDPVCTTDCPLIAQEFRQADAMLGPARSRHVELVAIAANPVYHSTADARAFDQQENLTGLANWEFLTGPLPDLRRAWNGYSLALAMTPAGGMVDHGDIAYVIDRAGRVRTELNFDPGPGTSATQSSFAAELAGAAAAAMGPS